MENKNILIKSENLLKIYHRGSEEIRAVNDVSLEIKAGEYVSIIGPSGSGKTTLINILGCLDNPTSGKLTIDDKEIFCKCKFLSETKLTRIRRELYGYIFQKFYLIPTLNVFENVLIPFSFYKKDEANPDVTEILKKLGIYERRFHLPNQLSGGEMQRVAIARALTNKPKILLADEPTGSLDTKRSDEISQILKDLNKDEKLTIILVTHNPVLAKTTDRIIELRDGKIYS